MSVNVQIVEQNLIAPSNASQSDMIKAAKNVLPDCKVDFEDGHPTVTYGYDLFPDGCLSNSTFDDAEALVLAFGSGSSITWFDRDESMFYDVENDNGSVHCRSCFPDRAMLFHNN